MRNLIWTRFIVAGVTACTIAALAAPASGQTLRRDGSKALPFVAHVGKQAQTSSSARVLRRDGSKAEPLVIPFEPDTTATTAASPGFDWGAAAIGAAAAVGLILLGSTAWIAAHRRRRSGVLRGSSA